jgi:hypothetical protein
MIWNQSGTGRYSNNQARGRERALDVMATMTGTIDNLIGKPLVHESDREME